MNKLLITAKLITWKITDQEINYYVSLQKGENQINLKINEFGSVEEL